jgi:WD40 repeat protein
VNSLDIIRVNDKEFILSSSDDGTIKLWNTNPNISMQQPEPFIPK